MSGVQPTAGLVSRALLLGPYKKPSRAQVMIGFFLSIGSCHSERTLPLAN